MPISFLPSTWEGDKTALHARFGPQLEAGMLLPYTPNAQKREAKALSSFPVKRKKESRVIMFLGRRGGGKSLLMTGIASSAQKVNKRLKNGYQIWSNYYMDFADYTTQYLIDEMIEQPWLCKKKLVLIDEIASAFPGRYWQSVDLRSFNNWLHQIRKLHSDVLMATQFPQIVDKQILLQVDLFVRCHIIRGGKAVRVEVYDYWGQFTGNDKSKSWPPEPGTQDYEKTFLATDRMFNHYDTEEIIGALWADNRGAVIDQSGHYEEVEVEQTKDTPDYASSEPGSFEEWQANLPNLITVDAELSFGREDYPDLFSEIPDRQALMSLLEGFGWVKMSHGNTWKARRSD